jgi:hypothetical protein
MSVPLLQPAPVPRGDEARTPALLLLAAMVALVMGGVTAFMPAPVALHAFQDDAFYYLQIARHVAHGDGFTFDGVHRTNGFHPLWLLTLVPLARVVPGDVLPVRAMILCQALLVALAAVTLHRALSRRVSQAAATCSVLMLVALPGTQLILACGMESALLLFLLARIISAWLALSGSETRPRAWFVLGAWCALAFLARLEAGIVGVVIVLLARRRWLQEPRALAAFLAAPVTVGSAYLAWNRLTFGLWLPVSGMVKLSPALRSRIGSPMPFIGRLYFSFRPLFGIGSGAISQRLTVIIHAIAMLALLSWATIARRRLMALLLRTRLDGPLLMCLALWLGESIAPHLSPWYPVPVLLMTSLVAAALVAKRPRVARAGALALALLGLGRATVHVWRDLRAGDTQEGRVYEAARWAQQNIPRADVVGSWNAGLFAYLSHLKVVNLDGLANDPRYYARVIIGHDLKGYVKDERIRWLADWTHATTLARPGYGFTTDDAAAIPLRLAYVRSLPGDTLKLGIWRILDEATCAGSDAAPAPNPPP